MSVGTRNVQTNNILCVEMSFNDTVSTTENSYAESRPNRELRKEYMAVAD